MVGFKPAGLFEEGEVDSFAFVFFVVQHPFVKGGRGFYGAVRGVFFEDEGANGIVAGAVEAQQADGEPEFGNDAVGNGVAVGDVDAFGDGSPFDGVPDGVPEVERLADSFFEGVGVDNGSLDRHGALYESEKFRGGCLREVGAQDVGEVALVGKQGVFEHFGETGNELAGGQRFEEIVVDDDAGGGGESAYFVFEPVEVDAGLPAHGGVYLRQEGGGDVDAADASLEAGGGKAAHVGNDASTDVYEEGVAFGPPGGKAFPDFRHAAEDFVGLARRQGNEAFFGNPVQPEAREATGAGMFVRQKEESGGTKLFQLAL